MPPTQEEALALKDRRLVEIRMALAAIDTAREKARQRAEKAREEGERAVREAELGYLRTIVQAHKDGASFSEIGSVLGVTKQRAAQLHQKAVELDGRG